METTRIRDTQIVDPPTAFTAIAVITPTGKVLVQPAGGLAIDLEADPPTIRALREMAVNFEATAGRSFALPANSLLELPVKIFKNGLLQREGPDYTIEPEGKIAVFSDEQDIETGDYVTIFAWV